MKTKAPGIDDMILQIHRAPLERGGWHAIMQTVMNLCGADNALMLTAGASAGPTITTWEPSLNFDRTALSEYAYHWGSQDLLYKGARQKGRIRPALVSMEGELVDAREYSSSAYFNEFCKPYGLFSHLNVCLTAGIPELNLGPSAMTLYRGAGKEKFSTAESEILMQLAPHLSVALRTSWHVEMAGMAAPVYQRALDELRIPVFAVDGAGKVILVNCAGENLVRTKRWVSITSGALAPSRTLLEPSRCQDALRNLRLGIGTRALLTDASEMHQAVLTTIPVERALQFQVSRQSIVGLVWLVPCAAHASSIKSLGTLFQLTPAEILLLQHLVDGVHLSDAAAQLRTSLNTVRTQLKSIFRKTGQRTQGQLLALAARMAMIRAGD
jgi:DNA-binding CsgD family transcriptional regulator